MNQTKQVAAVQPGVLANKKAAALQQGVNIMVVLAVFTALEYWIGVVTQMWWLLGLMALIKAVLVVQYYMHLPRLFSEEGGH